MSVSLKSPADIPAVVNAFLGFEPSDSLVIMGLGGGPSARVDINDEILLDSIEALSAASVHWTNGVIVALYSEEVEMIEIESAMLSIMPDVDVRALVAVTKQYGPTHVVTDSGELFLATPSDNPEIASKRVVASREALVAEAAECSEPFEAWLLARESYAAGNGARAWCYLDRFVELNGDHTDDSFLLKRFLENAIDPKSDTARPLFAA